MSLTAVNAGPDAGVFAPLRKLGARVLDERNQRVPYDKLVSPGHLHANVGQQPSTTTNGLLRKMTPGAAEAIMAATGSMLVQLRSLGGAVDAHTDGAYLNFESRPDDFRRFYPGAAGDRVLEVWRRYDPDGVFRTALHHGDLR